ncbi:MAG TPA: hypothetical protein VNF27_12765 [Candidatus Binataceae bacterium]|nr:hypothetical protein [Candidatus Binataceae bacterium]
MRRFWITWLAAVQIIFIAAALAAITGCWHRSPEAAQQAEILKQCSAGEISCVSPADSRSIIKCQAGDMPSCQALASKKCDRGDQHVCQSLAVIYSQLKPLCAAGNQDACADMKAPWPDSGFWRVDSQLAAAETACKSGDSQSCQALGTTVHPAGGRLIWLQNYVSPAPSAQSAPNP